MPEVRISIGGRSFEVLCESGQEPALQAAAGLLDAEANVLVNAIGRMTEPKMLLMAGLMLADKTLAAQRKVRALETRLTGAETARLAAETALAEVQAAPPGLPEGLAEALGAIATGAEALAARAEAAAGQPSPPAAAPHDGADAPGEDAPHSTPGLHDMTGLNAGGDADGNGPGPLG